MKSRNFSEEHSRANRRLKIVQIEVPEAQFRYTRILRSVIDALDRSEIPSSDHFRTICNSDSSQFQ